MSIEQAEAEAIELKNEIERLRSQLAAKEQDLFELQIAIKVVKTKGYDLSQKNEPEIFPLDQRFFGKSRGKAAILLLSLENRPMKTREIVDGLKRVGIELATSHPSSILSSALQREEDEGLLVRIGRATWDLTPKGRTLAAKEVEAWKRSASTKAGLDASRARGVKIGRKEALTPEKRSQALVLFAEGIRTTDIAKTIGISRAGLYAVAKELKAEAAKIYGTGDKPSNVRPLRVHKAT